MTKTRSPPATHTQWGCPHRGGHNAVDCWTVRKCRDSPHPCSPTQDRVTVLLRSLGWPLLEEVPSLSVSLATSFSLLFLTVILHGLGAQALESVTSIHLGDACVPSGEQASMQAEAMQHSSHCDGEKYPGGGLFITPCQHGSCQSPSLLPFEVFHKPFCHMCCAFPLSTIQFQSAVYYFSSFIPFFLSCVCVLWGDCVCTCV